MRESLLNKYNLKTDEDVEYFVKFANALYELKQNSEEKFQEYAEILRGILREQEERKNK
ncbi:TPA: hypothetical protein KN061_003206 [Clostridioides difficile]|uniref:hypothetical protein n=1 Tax=Clostridioides difficile TaxID=1496 RepID=UPI0007BC319B|nr:hypothetical protein [Clostridioides difficile]CZR77500.1 hypothetical protein CDFC105_51080 [Clostridioides difficile]HBF2342924.1 hypothetical protein [Clostridioides difficile]HBF5168036.1 hypothetical protein [Clostridioides difficile]HBG5180348.1 hypothetical protein [Clostridioides difficile]HCJ2886555.1 hypothetical protein [Clostridioides difficile]